MKINPNNKTTPAQTEKAARMRKALKAEEANFTERINKAYRSEKKPGHYDDQKSIEIFYDKGGNRLYNKTLYKDGSVQYTMNGADDKGRTTFTDLDNDGNMDKMKHTDREDKNNNFDAIDNNDDGTFDKIYWKI